MKKLLSVLSAALMMMALFAASAQAAPPEGKGDGPGPNGSNEKGLCTAYFNGQKKGHDKDGDGNTDKSPAFQGLEEAAGTYDEENFGDAEDNEAAEDREDEQQTSDDVFEYCTSLTEIMGQPEQNGRFDCREGEDRNGAPHDTDEDGEVECDPIADPE